MKDDETTKAKRYNKKKILEKLKESIMSEKAKLIAKKLIAKA